MRYHLLTQTAAEIEKFFYSPEIQALKERICHIGKRIFLAGGIIGTFHHLYFTGTPTAPTAAGGTDTAQIATTAFGSQP